jgi:VanZ like family.
MMRFFKRLSTRLFLPVGWTLITIMLLCLPGRTIPGEGLFSIPHFDKIVHILLFGGIVFWWGFHLYFRRSDSSKWRKTIVFLAAFSIVLGIVLEFLQLYCIPNRSFDGGDIIADAAGALLAGLYHLYAKVDI